MQDSSCRGSGGETPRIIFLFPLPAKKPVMTEAPPHETTDPKPIDLGDALRFFLPLIFMTELNMISKSVIHAFLACCEEETYG